MNGQREPHVYSAVTHSVVRTAVAGAIAWLALAGLLAAQFWPMVPTTTRGWALFVLVAPPMCLLVECVVEALWATRTGRVLSEHRSFVVRIMGGVLSTGIAMALLLFVASR